MNENNESNEPNDMNNCCHWSLVICLPCRTKFVRGHSFDIWILEFVIWKVPSSYFLVPSIVSLGLLLSTYANFAHIYDVVCKIENPALCMRDGLRFFYRSKSHNRSHSEPIPTRSVLNRDAVSLFLGS
jgi:hypothetical protein